MIRRVGIVAGAAVVAALFYLLLIDTRELPELLVLPAVVIFAVIALLVSGEAGLTEAALSPRWLLAAWRPLARVPMDTVLVLRALAAQLTGPRAARGRLRAVPFRGGHEGPDVGRIALTESLGSLAPNTIVVGVDPDRNLLLVHQLQPHGGAEELDALRL